uniref:RBR-type E3 ubiquitin transferase n=1 Tax=Leersia perrieri TaxID=77586 RepID=A0A0D9XE21_9ORYZ
MEDEKPQHAAATGSRSPTSNRHPPAAAAVDQVMQQNIDLNVDADAAAAFLAADEAFAHEVFMEQLMELDHHGNDDSLLGGGSSSAPGWGPTNQLPIQFMGSSSSASGSGGAQRDDISAASAAGGDEAPPLPAPAFERYVPPHARSLPVPRPFVMTGQPMPIGAHYTPAPARSAPAIAPAPAAALPQTPLSQVMLAAAAETQAASSSTGDIAADRPGAAARTRPPHRGCNGGRAGGGLRQILGVPHRTCAADAARWARAANAMARLGRGGSLPLDGQYGRLWTRDAPNTPVSAAAGVADTPATSAAGIEQSSPAISAGKGKEKVGEQISPPAATAGSIKGRLEEKEEEKEDEILEEYTNLVQDDDVSMKRQALLADRDTPAVFAGMEDGEDNDWYDSIIREAVITELQENPDIQGPLPLITPRSSPSSSTPRLAAAAGDEETFSMSKFYKKWGLRPSDLDPEEAGPSTRQPRVLPLDDDDLPTFDCGICFDTLPLLDLFRVLRCDHKFCLECMTTYIDGKVREGAVPVPCPDTDCKKRADGDDDAGILHPEGCKKAIDFTSFIDWGLRLAEGAVPHDRRAYCPNRRCGILLETSGEKKPAMAACPECQMLLCAGCGMEWRTADDADHRECPGPYVAATMKLADERRWKQCPQCKNLVERTAGCRVITCRCRIAFCYLCGLQMGQVMEGKEKCQCDGATF